MVQWFVLLPYSKKVLDFSLLGTLLGLLRQFWYCLESPASSHSPQTRILGIGELVTLKIEHKREWLFCVSALP